jgi:hypothetical protein
MPDLNKFISQFQHGFQQSNRFLVQLFVQPTMIANIIADSTLLGTLDSTLEVGNVVKWLYTGFLAMGARLPDRGFLPIQLSMYGLTEQFPCHTQFAPLQLTFMMPHTTNIFSDNGVPRFFNQWQNQIQHMQAGPESGLDFRFPADYYATIILTLLDKQDHGTLAYAFDNVYPITVDSAPLSWDSDNQFVHLPVTFNYSYWKVLDHLGSVAITALTNLL